MSLERLFVHIISGVPSNSRPHPMANSVSPVNTAMVVLEYERDMGARMRRNFQDARACAIRTARARLR
jgi:hypothetical protein